MKKYHIYIRTYGPAGQTHVTSAGQWQGITAQDAVNACREYHKNGALPHLHTGEVEVARVFELVETGDWK